MTEIGVDVATIDDVELAVAEACNNAVEHTGVLGYQAQVTVNDLGCVIRVIDSGPGTTGERLRPADVLDEGGRGVTLMHALADRVHFEVLEEQGTIVTLEKRFGEHGAS